MDFCDQFAMVEHITYEICGHIGVRGHLHHGSSHGRTNKAALDKCCLIYSTSHCVTVRADELGKYDIDYFT